MMRPEAMTDLLAGGNLCSFHIPADRPLELVADSEAEWSDLQELMKAGGIPGTTLAPDRHAVIFPKPEDTKQALADLHATAVV